MNPYFETDLGKLFWGDCLNILPQFEDESIDLILTDAPYNVSKKGNKISRGSGKFIEGSNINLDFGEWDYGSTDWREYIPIFVRKLTQNGVVVLFHDRLELGVIGTFLRDNFGFTIRHLGVWIKTNPAPQVRKVKWQGGTEMFLITTKNSGSGHHFNYKLGQSPNWFLRSVNQPKKFHSTQKPLDLIEWIANYWSFEDDLVIDPFLGSGTTAIACEKLQRRWIGIEIDEKNCQISAERIEAARKQLRLF